jgi:eukaryotic-like serine/threonine-protein kinase
VTDRSQEDGDADPDAAAGLGGDTERRADANAPVSRPTEALTPDTERAVDAGSEGDEEVTAPLDPPPNRPGGDKAPTARPLPTTVASSRFRILQRIGAGGFGVVYLAQDTTDGSEVALKTIPIPRAELRYRLKREFRALADLRHQNIVSFYWLFADEDPVFFTMEYVPGPNFLKYVRPAGSLDERRLRDALAQLVHGLRALHSNRKLHRDVKPSNVLVTANNRVVLLDFGLATELEENMFGKSLETAGTPEYMALEQMLGEPVSAASDWYSVGVMLYQALTDTLPFRGNWAEILAQKQRGEPLSPRDLVPGTPADLAELCLLLTARDPKVRAAAAERIVPVSGQGSAGPDLSPEPPDKPLVGRQQELNELDDAFSRVDNGEGCTVLLDGASGVGKTSLVDRFLLQARRKRGAIVLRGRCYKRERVPYQGIDSLIDDVCRLLNASDRVAGETLPRNVAALLRVFPVLERVPAFRAHLQRTRPVTLDEQEIRRQAFGALRELLWRLAERWLLILHIDDLQWGDLDTAKLLRELIRPPDAPPMLLILGFRSEDRERSPCLAALTGEPIGASFELHLRPLDSDAAGELMRALLPSDVQGIDVTQLTRGTDGNPFLIQELARAVADPAFQGTLDASPDVRQALRSRFARLAPAVRNLLETVAVAGHPVTEPVARRAAGLSGSPSADAWLLEAEHLLRISGPAKELEPFHDRIREAVVADLSPERAKECHRGLAQALEEAGSADHEVLAQHHEAAGNAEQALHFSVRAAEQADQALAFDRAVRLYRRAIGLLPGGDPQRVKLLAALGGALANSGRCVDAADTFLEAAEGETAAVERTRLRRRAAEQRFFAGQIDQGRKLIRADLRAQGFPVPRRRIAWPSLLFHRAWLRLRGLEPRRHDTTDVSEGEVRLLQHVYNVCVGISFVDALIGGEMAVRYFLRALNLGEPKLIARGRALIAGHAAIEAPGSKRTGYLIERMKQDAKAVAERDVDGDVACVRGLKAYFGGDWREALGHLDEAEKIFSEDCPGLVWELWTTRAVAVWALFFRGQWREMQRRVEAGLREGRDRGNLYAVAGLVSPFGVAAWLARDDIAGAAESLHEVTSRWAVRGFQFQKFWFLTAESLIRLYSGDGQGAWEGLSRGWDDVANPAVTFRFPMLTVQLLNVRGGCALAAAALEEPGSEARRELLRQAERAARRLSKVDVPQAAALADLLLGGVSAQRGRTDGAVTYIERAVQAFDRLGMDAYAAAARCRLAGLRGASAPAFLPDEGVVNPEAMIRMLAPGFPERAASG